MDGEPTIRRRLKPGDLGAIIAHHGRLYAPEFGVDSTFEGYVAASVAAAGKRGWPREHEGAWIVEEDGRHAGSLAVTDEGDGIATLRWFLLDPHLRGCGLGRRLLAEALEHARRAGYETLALETFSDLQVAARLYRKAGFELVKAQTGPRWGRDRLTYQRYELPLVRQPRAQSSSSSSTGARARPCSVSA